MPGAELGGAIIGIVDVAARLTLRLGQFLNEVRSAGATHNNLYKEAARLHSVLTSVRVASNKCQPQLGQPISDEEGGIRSTLDSALVSCGATVENLELKLVSLGQHRANPK